MLSKKWNLIQEGGNLIHQLFKGEAQMTEDEKKTLIGSNSVKRMFIFIYILSLCIQNVGKMSQ